MITSSRSIVAAAFFAAVLALNGCSDGGGPTASGTSSTTTGGGGTSGGTVTTPPPTIGAGCANSGTDIICVTLTSTVSSLAADNSSTATFTATLTRNSSPVGNTIIQFGTTSATMGSLSATSAVTTAAGTASTTFTAGGTIGAVGITVTDPASTATNQIALSLTAAPGNTPAGIQFVSATPSVLGVVGSGQPTTSSVLFSVTDSQGGPVSGQVVNFTLVGPTGAYIGTQDGTPFTASGTTGSTGSVSVTLNAGNVSGPVTITASVTVSGTTFRTSTSVISIGGAVPSASRFSIATERFNLPGLVRFGFENTISAFAADRFSNYNILAGTQVSFFTEAGAIDTSVNLSETGAGTVELRTQNPMPEEVTTTAPLNSNGWLRVIAVTRGEEAFVDVNGNGVYDAGVDTFTTASMDLGEPFVDANDNRVWDGPGCTQTGCITTHAGEFYVDANQNGRYDGPNNVWDGPGCAEAGCNQSPTIWTSIRLQFTGHIVNCTVNGLDAFGSFNVANGGFVALEVRLSDMYGNSPVPGTTSTVATTAGTLTNGSVTVADGVGGPFVHRFILADSAPTTSTATPATLTFTITPPSGETVTAPCSPFIVTGTVN
jgi:hypothetical protein